MTKSAAPRKPLTRKKAIEIVATTAINNAMRAGRTEPNILDIAPVCMTPEYLAAFRKAYGIS